MEPRTNTSSVATLPRPAHASRARRHPRSRGRTRAQPLRRSPSGSRNGVGTTRAVTRSAWSVSGNPPSGTRRIHRDRSSAPGSAPCRRGHPSLDPRRSATGHRGAPRPLDRTRDRRACGRSRAPRGARARGWPRSSPREPPHGRGRARRRVVRERVLSDVEMSLLEPEDLERIEPVGTEAERGALPDERRPEVRSSRPRMMELETHLADEATPDRPAQDLRHAQLTNPSGGKASASRGASGARREAIARAAPRPRSPPARP